MNKMLRLSLFLILLLVAVAYAKPGLFDFSSEEFGGRDSSEERGRYYPRGGEGMKLDESVRKVMKDF